MIQVNNISCLGYVNIDGHKYETNHDTLNTNTESTRVYPSAVKSIGRKDGSDKTLLEAA